MKVTSKNGIKIDISPKHWWNPIDWFWVFEQANVIKNQTLNINTEGFKFRYGSMKESQEGR